MGRNSLEFTETLIEAAEANKVHRTVFGSDRNFTEDSHELVDTLMEEGWDDTDVLELVMDCALAEYDVVSKDGIYVRDTGQGYAVEEKNEFGEWEMVGVTPEGVISDACAKRRKKEIEGIMWDPDTWEDNRIDPVKTYQPYTEIGYSDSSDSISYGGRVSDFSLSDDGTIGRSVEMEMDATTEVVRRSIEKAVQKRCEEISGEIEEVTGEITVSDEVAYDES